MALFPPFPLYFTNKTFGLFPFFFRATFIGDLIFLPRFFSITTSSSYSNLLPPPPPPKLVTPGAFLLPFFPFFKHFVLPCFLRRPFPLYTPNYHNPMVAQFLFFYPFCLFLFFLATPTPLSFFQSTSTHFDYPNFYSPTPPKYTFSFFRFFLS